MSSPTEHRGGAWRSRWAAIGAAVAVAMGAGGVGISQAVTSSGEKPIYLPIEPCRLADTRPAPNTVGPRSTPIGADETYTIDGWGAVGNCNLPTGTAGLSLNVTAVGATQQTNLRFFPAGVAVPTAANLNPTPGAPPTPNAVNVDLNGSGRFSVFNRFGSVAVVIDVVGIYDDHNHDDRYYTESEVDGLIAALGGDDYENVIVVAKSGGHFASVTAAMNAIGTDSDFPAASASNRYLVWVAPGIYENEDVDMKPFVDIEGSGQGVTVLRSVGGANGITPNAATLVGADDAELRELTVEIEASGASVWAYAIYTDGNTRFHRVTANGSGGSRARGMVIDDGGAPVLIDVIVRASGASSSNLGLDLVLATAFADGLFAEASGGDVATGIFVNTASSEVQMENVTTRASDGTSETNGFRSVSSMVTLEGYRTTVTAASSSNTLGARCDGVNSFMKILDGTVFVANSNGPARGVFGSDCSLELRNMVIDAIAEGTVNDVSQGIDHFQGSTTVTSDVSISDIEIRAESLTGASFGIQLNGNASGIGTYGSVSDATIRSIAGSQTDAVHGIRHNAIGGVDYRNMSIRVGGQANFGYGIQTLQGVPRFFGVVIDAELEAEATIFGAEVFTDGTTMDDIQVRAVNTDAGTGHDAVGLKVNNADDVVFRNVLAWAEAETNVWGVDITGGSARLARVDARAQGAPGNLAYGARCFNGSVEVADSNLAAAADSSTYGLYTFDCTSSRVVDSTTFGDTGATNSYGLYLFNNLATPGVHTVRGGVQEGAVTVSSWNAATVDVVDATLVGGAGEQLGISTQTCVGVVYDSGGSPAFDAGPTSPCP